MLRLLPLGHVWSDHNALLSHARTLEGHTAGEVADLTSIDISSESRRGKTGIGDIAERYVGKKRDNRREPDIPELGVELKTIPLIERKKGWRVKEATSISQIDPEEVRSQGWPEAYVRKKLSHVLWIPYEHDTHVGSARFRRPFLWRPEPLDLAAFARDYAIVQHALATQDLADVSESLCRVMGARRKDSKGGLRRAWALKTAFTQTLVDQHVLGRHFVALAPALGVSSDIAVLEARIEARLGRFIGSDLAEIAASTGAIIAGGKSGPASFVRTLLGVHGRGGIEEFEKFGIRIHTVWANPDSLKPHEAVSFPPMDLIEFSEEEWPEADLFEHVDRILFVPLFSRERRREQRMLGRPFFWSPDAEELSTIEAEWKLHQRLTRSGHAKYEMELGANGLPVIRSDGRPKRRNRLPKNRETACIHMRPHAANAADEGRDPLDNPVTGQSFWFNAAFIAKILERQGKLLPRGA